MRSVSVGSRYLLVSTKGVKKSLLRSWAESWENAKWVKHYFVLRAISLQQSISVYPEGSSPAETVLQLRCWKQMRGFRVNKRKVKNSRGCGQSCILSGPEAERWRKSLVFVWMRIGQPLFMNAEAERRCERWSRHFWCSSKQDRWLIMILPSSRKKSDKWI